MSEANPKGGGQEPDIISPGAPLFRGHPYKGWPFEFIGFLVAQNDGNGLTQNSGVRNIDKLTGFGV